jgi:hypothetical protein
MPGRAPGSVGHYDANRQLEVDMWPTDDPRDQLRWRISCTDSANEDRKVTVLVMGDRVALVLPLGNILVFTPEEAANVAILLNKAASYVETTN